MSEICFSVKLFFIFQPTLGKQLTVAGTICCNIALKTLPYLINKSYLSQTFFLLLLLSIATSKFNLFRGKNVKPFLGREVHWKCFTFQEQDGKYHNTSSRCEKVLYPFLFLNTWANLAFISGTPRFSIHIIIMFIPMLTLLLFLVLSTHYLYVI